VRGAYVFPPDFFETLHSNWERGRMKGGCDGRRMQRRLRQNEAVFVPACLPPHDHWCLYVLLPMHNHPKGGLLYTVDCMRPSRRQPGRHATMEPRGRRGPRRCPSCNACRATG
jgi:hypothetical protein